MLLQLHDGLKRHMFHLAWSPDSLSTVDSMKPLIQFVETNVRMLNDCFLRGNLMRCLHVVWESVLDEFAEHVEASEVVEQGFVLQK